MANIYQIKIELSYLEPKIWRRVLVKKTTKLTKLHTIIQHVMGWDDYHLYQFIKNKKYYLETHDDFYNENDVDITGVKISNLLTQRNESIKYIYDFGDDWEHIITLEKIIPYDKDIKCPVCIDGENACPPEDCGGIGQYMEILAQLNQPGGIQNPDLLEWLGDDFNPTTFDIEIVNQYL